MTDIQLPASLLKALKEMGIDPDEVIVIEEPQKMVPKEEALDRFRYLCRNAYRLMRDSFEVGLTHRLFAKTTFDIHSKDSIEASFAALVLEAFKNYITDRQKADPEQFKTDMIAALDRAVQEVGHALEETHDACTKQSDSNGSSEPS